MLKKNSLSQAERTIADGSVFAECRGRKAAPNTKLNIFTAHSKLTKYGKQGIY